MSAMRLMSKTAFYAALRKNGFNETDDKTSESTVWFHEETGKHFPIPHYSEEYPDCILDTYLRAVGKLYTPVQSAEIVDKQQYCVTEKIVKKPELVKLYFNSQLPTA